MTASDPGPAVEPRLAALVDRLAAEGRIVALRRAGRPVEATALAGIHLAAIADDSRHVQPGALFAAVRGLRVDGHDYLGEALARGARAVIVERETPAAASSDVIEVVVDRSARALGSAAAWWHGDPSRTVTVIGITGTNGKTTTSFLLAAGLAGTGRRVGLSTTVGTIVGGAYEPNSHPVTTPSALDLQALLRRMVVAGDDTVALETSSHGLAADRVAGVAYQAAIFTTLSHEHLDFHGTMEAYVAAKRSLFERLPQTACDGRSGVGIVNLDDARAATFIAAARATGAAVVTYGEHPAADVRLTDVAGTARSVDAGFAIDGRVGRLRLRFGGRYNARNALAVVALAHAWGLPMDSVVKGIGALAGVPGRLEVVDVGQPFTLVVDFAHTPGSIEALLAELRSGLEPGRRVAIVFGASGERDEGKRPLMGAAAARGADLTILTEDDPRGEDLGAILAAIINGATAAGGRPGESVLVMPDRTAAIEAAVRWARPGDVVVLAGKGHETWMARQGGLEPWDDRAEAVRILAREGFAAPVA